jgi:hypothetical protein
MPALECHCALCGEKMRVQPELAGRMAECPACLRDVPVPGVPQGGRGSVGLPDLPAGILCLDVKFLCRDCGARLVIDGRWEGRAVDCPACNALLSVPVWSGRRALERNSRRAVPALSQDEIHFLSADLEIRSR